MKIIVKAYFILSFLLFASSAKSQGILGGIEGNFIVKDILDKASEEIKELLAVATKNADYLLEKNLSRVSLMIDNLQYNLSKDLDKRFDQLKRLEKDAIHDINELAQNIIQATSKKFLEAKEFLVMDVSDLLDKVPFIKKRPYISSIEGIGQRFRIKGFYSVTIKGTALKFENTDSIYVNGKIIKNDDIIQGRNMVTFNISADIMNDKFKDDKLNRVDFTIRSYDKSKKKGLFKKNSKPTYSYTGKLLLLPKMPVTKYTLVISTNTNRWSKEEFDSEIGHALLVRSPKKDQWSSTTLSTSVPPGCLMIKDKVKVWTEPPKGWCNYNPNFTFDEAKNTISTICSHQWHDSETDFYIQCK